MRKRNILQRASLKIVEEKERKIPLEKRLKEKSSFYQREKE